jgi:hypothetical protein
MEIASISWRCAVIATLMFACGKRPSDTINDPVFRSAQFREYWHAGKAEVNSYNLEQSRYGEPRKGKAVLIFVTEDLSKKLQVKLDDPSRGNKVNVLKLNFTKNFITGIYPYSLMLSVCTPTYRDKERSSLKAAMSSQEWCGQVYTQMNLRGNRYAVKSHSYFEQEADDMFSVRDALLEDELWNLIRLDPDRLPVGDIEVVPGLFYTRLSHVDLRISDAIGEKAETDSAFVYTLRFPEDKRVLSIRYQKTFPYRILGWKETWIERGKNVETFATLDKTLYTDYWTKNKNEYVYLRDSLNLPVSQ